MEQIFVAALIIMNTKNINCKIALLTLSSLMRHGLSHQILVMVTQLALNVFMARRAIPIVPFHRVESIYIYIYVCVTCATMRCIRS